MANKSQWKKIYDHLQRRKSITAVEANGLYGISRLAAIIPIVRERTGREIKSEARVGINKGARYAVYSLVPQ